MADSRRCDSNVRVIVRVLESCSVAALQRPSRRHDDFQDFEIFNFFLPTPIKPALFF